MCAAFRSYVRRRTLHSLKCMGMISAMMRVLIDMMHTTAGCSQLASAACAHHLDILQVIAGVLEERGIEVIFAGNPRLQNVLSFVARTGNTFLGSLMWVDYVRLLGLQGGPKH